METTFAAASGLYWIAIQPSIVSSFTLSYKDKKVYLWYRSFSNSSSTSFRKIIPYFARYYLQLENINSRVLCQACMQGKLIAKSSL